MLLLKGGYNENGLWMAGYLSDTFPNRINFLSKSQG
jgi:hypothetical protein